MLTKHQRFFRTFADLGFFGHVMEETKQEVEFVCLIYGDKKCKRGQAASKNSSPEIQEAENCPADYVTTMLSQSGIPHPALEL